MRKNRVPLVKALGEAKADATVGFGTDAMRCVLNRSSTRLGRRLKELTAVRRDRLLDRAQRLVHVPQLILGRHPLERSLDLAVAAQVLFAVNGVLHLLVELGLRPRHRIRDRADARIEVDDGCSYPLRHDCPGSRDSVAFFAMDLPMIAER